MITLALLLAVASALLVFTVLGFVQLERRGRGVIVVGLVWGLVVLDAATFHGFDRAPGLLHPYIGSLSFRLPEVLIALALAARVLALGMPKRVSPALLWWGAWSAWYGYEALVGFVGGHKIELILFEGKAIVYVVGALILAAGVPVEEYVRVLPRWLRWASLSALVMIVLALAGVEINVPNPIFPLENFGRMGGDAATVYATLGVLALTLGSSEDRRSVRRFLVAVPLLLAPFATDQRAAMLGVAVALVIVAVVWLGPIGRRALQVTPTELVLVVLGLAAFAFLPTLGSAATEAPPPRLPFAEEVTTALTSQAKAQSAESRENQWREASALIAEHPWMGWGLGKQYWYYEQGPDEMWESNITHSILFDVGMRSGVIGLVLLAVALAASMLDGLRALRSPDARTVALAVACLALITGLLTKGLVESIFEKYLLATTLGLLLGMLRSAARDDPRASGDRSFTQEDVPSWS